MVEFDRGAGITAEIEVSYGLYCHVVSSKAGGGANSGMQSVSGSVVHSSASGAQMLSAL
jgi:hypothetical protein